jgi:cytochrome c biogenesis protein CcmG/thiol:disulfide interchange protein DsbE
MMRALVCGAVLALLAGGAAAVAPGSAAPDFTLDGRSGTVTLADYRGKFVYLDFWASWCAPCKRSFPWMGALQQRHAGAGLQVVAVNLDTRREDAERFLAQTPAGFVVAFDPAGAIARQYAIKGMPSSVLIGPDGTVLQVHAGFTDDATRGIESALSAALGKGKR